MAMLDQDGGARDWRALVYKPILPGFAIRLISPFTCMRSCRAGNSVSQPSLMKM
jgi:hypothetical protein